MEAGRFNMEFFCRLCASEGIIIHPLFPPGDDDPKDELVRMIDVLTSVQLTRLDDAGAGICDKCLQALDLFCRFREECLRQDVLIRTKRTLLSEEFMRQQLLIEQQQKEAELLLRLQQGIVTLKPPEISAESVVKLEDDDESSRFVHPVIQECDVQILPSLVTPPAIEIQDCKEECRSEEISEGIEDAPGNVQHGSVHIATGDDGTEGPDEASSPSDDTFPPPNGFSLFTQAGSLSISVQVNQMSLGAPTDSTFTAVSGGTLECDKISDSPITNVTKRTFRRCKPNVNKPPPGCDLCQESFDTHYQYHQHMDQFHTWDKNNRNTLACEPCQMRFTKSYNLKRHMYEVHGELSPGMTVTPCPVCGEQFLRGNILERHMAKMHRTKKKLKIIAIK